MPTGKQTDRQTNNNDYISSLADVINVTYLRKQTIPIASIASQIPTARVTMITSDMPVTAFDTFARFILSNNSHTNKNCEDVL